MTVDSNPSIVIEEPCVTANILHTVSAESDTFFIEINENHIIRKYSFRKVGDLLIVANK